MRAPVLATAGMLATSSLAGASPAAAVERWSGPVAEREALTFNPEDPPSAIEEQLPISTPFDTLLRVRRDYGTERERNGTWLFIRRMAGT